MEHVLVRPAVSGAFWNGLALDHYFEDTADGWASMRTSWTDINGWYVAMKGGKLTGHTSHGNLDGGDFVIDHDGVRWAGELGSGDYIADDYFDPETQASGRWLYYRTRTEGQNTLVVDQQNQDITAVPTCKLESQHSPGVKHRLRRSLRLDRHVYYGSNKQLRWHVNQTRIRFPTGRTRVLLQDDITNAAKQVQWRMHTNATVAVDGSMATLSMKMCVHILNAPTGVAFNTLPAQRSAQDPALPAGMTDQPNPGVTVLAITLQPGTYNLQVLFDPTWSGQGAAGYTPPALMPIDQWSATSHS